METPSIILNHHNPLNKGEPFAMNTITQTMQFRKALINYSLKHGVTKAAFRYKVNRQYVYRWRKRYDRTLQSLADLSRRPHYHSNQHTEAELKLISDIAAAILMTD